MKKAERETRLKKMIEMRESGKTYQAIGEEFGLSRQRVCDLVGDIGKGKMFRLVKEYQCIFPNLRQWMNKNLMTIAGLARLLYGQSATTYKNKLRKMLNGESDIHKKTIDKILDLTGMAYEECFAEE
jgi:hypothetical protein